MRKDIKKSSYYVWFLGAQEAKGLRGVKYINPVIRSLIEREREVEPFKVTLQVSYKGLKIIQNLPNSDRTGKNRKPDVVKHFIPHHAVTCVLQDEDIVACILLLYNPVTKCPVHVHGYRCDSVETAAILSGQLQILIERPENQKKLSEIEVNLKAKGLLTSTPPPVRRLQKPLVGSDTKSSSSRDSEFSRASSTERIASLYDSLAAELREKLTGDPQPQSPILLPPRDYDTVHRQKGNLSGIDLRRCLSMNVVGMNVTNNSRTKFDSSGASSGIGSDHAPSPDQDSDARFHDSHSTSDEDMVTGLPLILEKAGQLDNELSLPKTGRINNFPLAANPVAGYRCHGPKHPGEDNTSSALSKVQSGVQQKLKSEENLIFNKEHLKNRKDSKIIPQTQIPPRPEIPHNKQPRPRRIPEDRQRSPSPVNEKWLDENSLTPRDRFNDAKEKFLWLEREKLEQEKLQRQSEHKRLPQTVEPPYYRKSWTKSKASEDDPEAQESQHIAEYFFGNDKDKSARHDPAYPKNHSDDSNDAESFTMRHDLGKMIPFSNHKDELSRAHSNPYDNTLHLPASITREGRNYDRYSGPRHEPASDFMKREDKLGITQNSPRPLPRMYSENSISEETPQRVKPSKGPINSHSFTEDNTIPLERYRNPTRINEPLRPTPRQQYYPVFKSEENETYLDYRQPSRPENHYYLPQNKFENKSHFRSLHDSIQDEKRRNSNEIANEFKRRSYQAQASSNPVGYQELDEFERHPGLDRDTARMHGAQGLGESVASPRYRHSYAEPFLHHQPQLPHNHEILHRNNSSVSTGRVGIAAVHPY